MATWHAADDRASTRRMRQVVLVIVAALLLWPVGRAHAAHEPVGACSPGFTNVRNVDPETFFDGRSNLTICLGGDLEDLGNHEVQWSNMSHVTIRSAPGSWRAIRSRIWIDQTSNVNTNTIAFPHHRYNLAGCDFGPDTPDCHAWAGSNNLIERSCSYSTVSGYSGDPLDSGISPGRDNKFGRVDHATITVTDPQFRNRTTPAHAWRDYHIPPSNPCAGYQPAAPVGPPG